MARGTSRRGTPTSTVKAWIQRNFPGGGHFNPPVQLGSNMTLSWTGEGELEFAYSITGPWWMAVNQNNPQSVPINNGLPVGQTFYRIRSYYSAGLIKAAES